MSEIAHRMWRSLRRIISHFFKKSKSEPEISDVGQTLRRQYQEARETRPRTTIRPSDGGFRKLKQHGKGRGYDKRSGFDPNKKMVDIKDGDTRPPKKKRGWAEDRDKR